MRPKFLQGSDAKEVLTGLATAVAVWFVSTVVLGLACKIIFRTFMFGWRLV